MKKIIVLCVTVLAFMTSVQAGGWTYPASSNWAQDELDQAMVNGIAPEETYDNYSRNITREEFAEVVMNLYYENMKSLPEPASEATFSDTKNKTILRAYSLGIINGKGQGIFAPQAPVTRQEMAVMMQRALISMAIPYTAGDGVLTVKDKGEVASWATGAVDFAFENGIIKGDGSYFNPLGTTPVEQGLVIVNRVFEKYQKTSEPNDYSQGYTLEVNNMGLWATFNNNDQTSQVVSFTEPNPEKGGGYMNFDWLGQVKKDPSNPAKIYFVDGMNRMWQYNFEEDLVDQLSSETGGALNVQDYDLVDTGKFAGYLGIEVADYFTEETAYYAYDNQGNYYGQLEMLTDLNYQLGELYSEKNEFAIRVTDPVNYQGHTLEIKEDSLYFYSGPTYYSYYSDLKGYLRLNPQSDSAERYCGPLGRAGVRDAQHLFDGYGGIYKTDMTFHEEEGNAGIVFNLQEADHGNDNYRGFYAGVSPENDSVIFGKSDNKWTMLDEVDLGFDIKEGDTVTLEVQKLGVDISVFVNGHRYIYVLDSSFIDDGGFGIRSWKCEVSYSDYTIKPLE